MSWAFPRPRAALLSLHSRYTGLLLVLGMDPILYHRQPLWAPCSFASECSSLCMEGLVPSHPWQLSSRPPQQGPSLR